MMIPTIHLNGTSKERLLEAIGEALLKLNDAMIALADAGPNGRDYYPQGPDAMRVAQDEHFARMKKLQDVQYELSVLAEAIDKQ